ncbi:MAG: hypothetical protein R3F61_24705 [Myxococcota bacterium]
MISRADLLSAAFLVAATLAVYAVLPEIDLVGWYLESLYWDPQHFDAPPYLDWALRIGLQVLLPLPAWLGALFLLRPRRPVPEGLPATDWGTRLGHAWVAFGPIVRWVPADRVGALVEDAEPATPEPHLSGFDLALSPPGVGLPDPLFTAAAAAAILTVAGGVWSLAGSSDLRLALQTVVWSWFVLLPWAFLGARLPRILQRRGSRVRVDGQHVDVDGVRFLLGQDGQTLRFDGGRLVLENQGARVEVHGAASELAILRDLLVALSREGDREDVPEALRAVARRGQPVSQ